VLEYLTNVLGLRRMASVRVDDRWMHDAVTRWHLGLYGGSRALFTGRVRMLASHLGPPSARRPIGDEKDRISRRSSDPKALRDPASGRPLLAQGCGQIDGPREERLVVRSRRAMTGVA
jgi:hypothetical protein